MSDHLGHWEGDGYLSVNGWSTNPSPAVIQGMITWENNRQKAIDDAKAHTSFTLAAYGAVNLQPAFLSVSILATGVVANWTAGGVGLVLYAATNLVSPIPWMRITNLPALIGGRWQIDLSSDTNDTRFFRLEAE